MTLKKFLILVPPPLLYALGGLVVLYLLSFVFRPRRRHRVLDSAGEIKLTLACTQEQAEALLLEYQGDAARAIMDVKQGRRALPLPAASDDGFAVVLGPDEVKDPVVMAKLLSQSAGLSEPEALRLIVPGGGGLLARGLSEEMAAAFVAALGAKNVPAQMMLVKELPQPKFGGDIVSLTMDSEGATLELRGGSEHLPWRSFQLLCLGVVKPECKVLGDGTVPAARGELVAHLYVEGGRRFNLEARRFNYAGLGERKRQSAVTNFQVVIQDLTQWAPAMATNRSVGRFLNDLQATAFASENELVADGIGRLATLRSS